MITGDNPLTAAAIASEAGVDDFLAQATPKDKLEYIKKEQAEGRLVAMTGDGTNDAPALAQADVGVAMNTGTMAAKEAGNMVDLDSNPTKLIEIVAIGKQLLITRGALTTFSIANDVAKYFAIIPAMFMSMYPELGKLNIMGLHSPQSAVLVGRHFQCPDYHRAGSAGVARRAVQAGQRRPDAEPESADLWTRRNHRAVSRHLGDRQDHRRAGFGVKEEDMIKELGPGFRLTLIFTVLTGLIYPAVMTGISQLIFPSAGQRQPGDRRTERLSDRASSGRPFSKPEYFHPRPSSAGSGYDATASSGSNLGPTSAKLLHGTTKMDDKNNEVVDFDGISLRVVHYCLDNDIPYESSMPLGQIQRRQGRTR